MSDHDKPPCAHTWHEGGDKCLTCGATRAIEPALDDLRLVGGNHLLHAIPVRGEMWVGMIEVQSPTNAALLTPEHARRLRDWLDQALAAHKPFVCPCGHGKVLHGDTVDGECLICDDCEVSGA